MPGIRNQRPIHSAAILPLMDLVAHASQLRRDAGNKPLTDQQKQTLLHLSVDVLKVIGFTEENIVALFPQPVKNSPPPSATLNPPVVDVSQLDEVKQKIVPTPEKTGLFGRK